MPRSGRLRNFIKEYKASPKTEKLSFIPPFLILLVEAILLIHAFTIDVPDIMVVELTSILLIISIIEIILVTREIHENYSKSNFDKVLTIRLDDFIIESKEINVKKIVTDFIEKYPEYRNHRSDIYHTTCQILETHNKELLDEDLSKKLKKLIKEKKQATVDEIIEDFVKKYPKYRSNRSEIYEKTCQLMEKLK